MLNPYLRSLLLALIHNYDIDDIANQLTEMGWSDVAIKPDKIRLGIELLLDCLIFDLNAETRMPF